MDPELGPDLQPVSFHLDGHQLPGGHTPHGYPVEIQALWYYALRFLSRIDIHKKNAHWSELAGRVENP